MIEISDKMYWKELNYYDGGLYCSLLEVDGKNDWRMIKDVTEWVDNGINNMVSGCWYQRDGRGKWIEGGRYWRKFWIVPVRDILDD